MKKATNIAITAAIALIAGRLTASATVFFEDTFTGGSTLTNLTPSAPTPTSASYQLSSSKPITTTNALPDGYLKYGIGSTTGGGMEVQALFTTTPVALVLPGDYVQLIVTFTNAAGLLTANGGMGFGLYNGGQVQPVAGGLINLALASETANATGGVQNWQGYWGQLAFTGANSRILNRSPQTGVNNRNQNLTSTGSSSQSYGFPAAAVVGTASTAPSLTLVPGQTYTVLLQILLTGANTLAITNTTYSGPNTNGTVLSQFGGVASGATYLTSTFDALGIGWRAQANTTGGTVIDISSIRVEGSVTVITTPPDIITQPLAVTVPSGGSCASSVVAQSPGSMTYQWKRYTTNLVNGGNISGATTDTLIISPASAADVASGPNGYYVTVTGPGGYSTNSVTNSLTLGTAKNLIWNAAGGNVWDLNNTASWQAPGPVTTTFNFGDSVTFDSSASLRIIQLNGKYLSASSVTVDCSDAGAVYNFSSASSGGIAGPGQLIYKGADQFTIGNVNTHTGGTLLTNSASLLFLQNYGGLGTGPVTFAKDGVTMEVVPVGSASVGIAGDVNIQDNCTIQFDGTGAFAGVMLGNLNGVAGKTLTLNQPSATTNRYRVYGTSSVMNSDIIINGNASGYPVVDGTVLAPYNPSGVQFYNGVISGNGGVIQRGNGTSVFSGQNTYLGGTIPSGGTIGIGADSIGTVTSGPLGTGPLLIVPELPNTTGSGTVLAWGGARTIANALQYPSATNNQTLIIGGTNALTFSGPVTLNGNDGIGTQTNRIFQVGNTALTTISGVISGTGFGITKTGNGILDLTATETYTGPTLVSNGVLRINGSLNAASAVTVATNATLGGAGTIGGNVSVLAGGILAPGNSIGTLNIGGNLTLSGNLDIEVNRSGLQSDKTVVSGTLSNTGNGRATVSNLGSPLLVGDKFFLFNKAVSGGGTMTVTGAGAYWQNDLAVDGSITVHQLPSITSVVPGVSDITLSGVNGIAGGSYVVLASTNVTAALSTWTRIQTNTFGGGGSFTATIPVSASIPARFFTLQLP